MKKTFPEICLERAEKASPGPWEPMHCDYALGGFADDKFIARARDDVPELCRRLERAIQTISMLLEMGECRQDEDCDHCVALQVIEELEAPIDSDSSQKTQP